VLTRGHASLLCSASFLREYPVARSYGLQNTHAKRKELDHRRPIKLTGTSITIRELVCRQGKQMGRC